MPIDVIMKKLTSIAGLVTLAALLALAGSSQAAPRYHYKDLGTFHGGIESLARGINDAGQVVGRSLSGTPFLWEQGVRYNLDDLTVNLPANLSLSQPVAINDRGWITGTASNGFAFLLTPVTGPIPQTLLLLE
jgi:hypothetical protein